MGFRSTSAGWSGGFWKPRLSQHGLNSHGRSSNRALVKARGSFWRGDWFLDAGGTRGGVIGFGPAIVSQEVPSVPAATRANVVAHVAVPGRENSASVKGKSGNIVAAARRTSADLRSALMVRMPRIRNEVLVDVEP